MKGPDLLGLGEFFGLHKSTVEETFDLWKQKDENIKRLAFFGDAWLQWIVVDHLHSQFPTLLLEQLQKILVKCTCNETMDVFLQYYGICASRGGEANTTMQEHCLRHFFGPAISRVET